MFHKMWISQQKIRCGDCRGMVQLFDVYGLEATMYITLKGKVDLIRTTSNFEQH